MRQADPQGFLILPENRLALAAVKRLGPRSRRSPVKLVTLVGPPGAGKSHLARELLRSWDDQTADGKRLCVTASQFAAELAEASVRKTISRFQSRYRQDVQLLVVEDLQTLTGKTETQQQLTAALDDVLRRGGVVLCTASRMPGAIPGLSRRLVNRLHGGLCVELRPPGPESRRKLLQHFLARESFRLPPKDLEALGSSFAGSPRELLGLLSQLRAAAEAQPRQPGAAAQALRHTLEERRREAPLDLEQIARASAKRFEVSLEDLRSPRRAHTISLARQSAMFLARELLQLNYADIGEYFRRENHSTVIHACRRIQKLLETDSDDAQRIGQLRDELRDLAPRTK